MQYIYETDINPPGTRMRPRQCRGNGPYCELSMSFQTLDLNLLRVFDAVMIEQNLTRAAMRLSMTQPAVSNALRRLREALGDDLLVWNAHGVTPTSRAEELWPAVRLALTALEKVITPQASDLSEMHATFRFAMTDSTAALVLPSLMREIKLHAPHICIRLVPPMARDPKPLLLQGEIDLAVGHFPGVAAQISGGQGRFLQSCTRAYIAARMSALCDAVTLSQRVTSRWMTIAVPSMSL